MLKEMWGITKQNTFLRFILVIVGGYSIAILLVAFVIWDFSWIALRGLLLFGIPFIGILIYIYNKVRKGENK